MIYLDNAATTLKKPAQVADAMLQAMHSAGNSARGTHAGSLTAARIIYDARSAIADLFGCARADHVVFTSNVTEALNTAIVGLIKLDDHVITTDLEHNSVLRPLYRLQDESNVQISFLPTDSRGNPIYAELENLLRPNTRAIICTHASNLTGNLMDLAIISEFARAHDLLLIVDAAQTAGSFPIDVEALGIDVLCFTGHKGLMGPQGTGGMCIRGGVDIRPLKVGGTGVQSHSRTQPEQLPAHLEAGTLNVPGIAGLKTAVDFIRETGIDRIHAHEALLMNRFLNGVRGIPDIRIYGDFSADRAPIVALNIGDTDSGEVADALSERYGIAVRSGAHCAPRMHAALGTQTQGAVRFSFAWFNTESEIDEAIRALRELAAE